MKEKMSRLFKKHGVEKVGKPWPGPPLAGTSSKHNVHRRINLKDSEKLRNPNSNTQKAEVEKSAELQEEAGPQRPFKKRIPVWADILVITVLWTVEVIHFVINALNERYFKDIFTLAEQETIDTLTDAKFILIYNFVPMLAFGTFLTFTCGLPILQFMHDSKYWIMFTFLTIYAFSAIVGVILAATRNTAVAISLAWQELSWYAVHPIRFWFIFHQRFPLSVRWSHLYVSGNVLIIEFIEMLVTCLLKNAEYSFSRTFYAIFYGTTALISGIWLLGIFYIHRFVNTVPEDLDSTRIVYAETEVLQNFNSRQMGVGVLLFLASLYPAVIFPIIRVFVDFGHIELLENYLTEDLGMRAYRLDLVTALLVVIVVEAVLLCLRKIRNAISDLILIVTAHICSIAALFMIMQILYLLRDSQDTPGSDEAILVVSSDNQFQWFLQVGDDINDLHRSYSYYVLKNLPDDRIVRIRFASSATGQVRLDDYLDIQLSRKSSVNAYNFMKQEETYKLVRIPSFPSVRYKNENKARVFFVNGLEECDNFDQKDYERLEFSPNTTRGGKILGLCLPMSIMWYKNGSNVADAVRFKPPANNEVVMFEIPCDPRGPNQSDLTRRCSYPPMATYFHNLKQYLQDPSPPNFTYWSDIRPYNLYMIRIELIRGQTLPVFYGTNILPYREHHEDILATTLSLFGVSFGLAWVGYIHFMWIQSPVTLKMLSIYSFFASIFAASSLTKRNLLKFNENSVSILIVLAVFCFLWQLVATSLFCRWMKRLPKVEAPQRSFRRY